MQPIPEGRILSIITLSEIYRDPAERDAILAKYAGGLDQDTRMLLDLALLNEQIDKAERAAK
jgi:hypothetical protein